MGVELHCCYQLFNAIRYHKRTSDKAHKLHNFQLQVRSEGVIFMHFIAILLRDFFCFGFCFLEQHFHTTKIKASERYISQRNTMKNKYF